MGWKDQSTTRMRCCALRGLNLDFPEVAFVDVEFVVAEREDIQRRFAWRIGESERAWLGEEAGRITHRFGSLNEDGAKRKGRMEVVSRFGRKNSLSRAGRLARWDRIRAPKRPRPGRCGRGIEYPRAPDEICSRPRHPVVEVADVGRGRVYRGGCARRVLEAGCDEGRPHHRRHLRQ